MEGLREYVLRVVAAAVISGVLIRLTKKNGSGEVIRMLCGIFMTIILIHPIAGRKAVFRDVLLPDITGQAASISEEGTAAADNIRREFIKQRVETYILSRAEAMDADIQADISLGEDSVPASVRITGRISPLNRSKLAQMIASDLGIPREQQEWIG